MDGYQRKHRRRRRRSRLGRLYGAISVLVILAAVIGGCIVFFRVDEVTVEGNERYSAEEIVAVSEVEQGDDLFLINKEQISQRLLTQLSYLEGATIRRDLPSTLRIIVTECDVAAAVWDEGTETWWLVSSGGKLLEQAEDAGEHLSATGLTLVAPAEGGSMAVEEEQRLQLEALLELLESMEQREMLSQAESIDLSSASIVTMEYAGRLTVKMELSSDFDYQMRVLAKVMEEYVEIEWDESDTGTLDLTQDDGDPHLIRDAT